MKRLLALLLLVLPCVASAQTVTMPQSVPVSVGRLAAVEMTYDGTDFKYIVPPELDAFREFTNDPKVVRLRVIAYQQGMFRIVAVACKGEKLSDFGSTLVIVGQGPGPTPIPGPGPTPEPPGPTPPIPTPPVVVGPRAVLIVHEVADKTPDFARLITALRAGPQAEYLKTKGHTLRILDDDSLDQDGKPALEAWRPYFSSLTLPVLLVIDPTAKVVLHKESIAPSATAESVVQKVKEHGG